VHAPEKLDDPFASYVAYLRQSNGLVEKFMHLKKQAAFATKVRPRRSNSRLVA